MPPSAELDSLIRIGGGKLIPFLDDISREMHRSANRQRQLVVVCDKINPHALREETRRLRGLEQLQDPAPAAVVNYQWVLNSISEAKLRDFP